MEDTIDLRDEIRRISIETKFSPILLEKDYHLTRILHKLSEKRIKDLVFKGGTCLNKCYLGFYRLSEDLDFVYNQDVNNLSKTQTRKTLDKLRRDLIKILDELGFETNNELGKGWKMLTSKDNKKIIGLEIKTNYASLIDGSTQTIKLEASFRKKLIKPSTNRTIRHEFVNSLGHPILKKDVEIEVIDLSENFAEKYRALLTRKNIAIRDIYDISFILKNNILKVNEEILGLILLKINENDKEKFTKADLINFIESLESKLSNLNEKEISSVLKSDEIVDMKSLVCVIVNSFK